jgi:O-methyltransferase
VPVVLRRRSYDELRDELARVRRDVSAIRKRIERRGVVVDVGDAEFRKLAEEVVSLKRTMLREDRLWILWQATQNAAPVTLAAAEVGTFRGGSAYFIAAALRHARGEEVHIDVIDTFEGHVAGSVTALDHETHSAPGKFRDTSFDDVVAYLSPFARTVVHKGDFESVAPELAESHSYGFVHIDVDLYEPALASLRWFGERVPVGGVIVVDDFGAPKCPGIKSATDQFRAEMPQFHAWHPHTEQLVLAKVR